MVKKELCKEKVKSSDSSMLYGDYLQLNSLLSSQHCRSDHHDEMLFILIHQVNELWMKLLIHELPFVMDKVKEGSFYEAQKGVVRVSRTFTQMIASWEVLSTLTPDEYLKFRDVLGQASGFQSYQYRLLEFYFGNKNKEMLQMFEDDPALYEKLVHVLHEPSIYDVTIQQLQKEGFSIYPEQIDRDWSEPYQAEKSIRNAWLAVYKNRSMYPHLYQWAESLIQLEDGFQQWRFRHLKTVERVIGFKRGTGGSPGVPYLRKVLDQRFFPELWEVRTEL